MNILPGRLIGIDVGQKRVGLARTDPMQLFPSAIGTFTPKESLLHIEEECLAGQVAGLVVGWPQRDQDEPSDAMKMVERYIKKLHARFPSLPVYKVDEYLSSQEAMQVMIESGVPKHKRREKGRVDQVAASLILERYLQSQN